MTMHAILQTRYGPPTVLRHTSVARPVPGETEVLVRVQAASINAADHHMVRGRPLIIRAMAGLRVPRHPIPGADMAGRVAAVGGAVTRFKPGAAVFGDLSAAGGGAFAEYACADEKLLARKPDGVSCEAAAAVPLAGVAVLQGLRDKGKIQAGQRVLINGASGNLGLLAVQMARHFGATVTGVCSPGKMELVRGMGAERVVDYTRHDVTREGIRYDLIFDTAAYRAMAAYRRILTPQGRYVMTGGSVKRLIEAMLLGPWLSRAGGRHMGAMMARPKCADLETVGGMLAAGALVPVIHRRFALRETAMALRYYESGNARGKIVISMPPEPPAAERQAPDRRVP